MQPGHGAEVDGLRSGGGGAGGGFVFGFGGWGVGLIVGGRGGAGEGLEGGAGLLVLCVVGGGGGGEVFGEARGLLGEGKSSGWGEVEGDSFFGCGGVWGSRVGIER